MSPAEQLLITFLRTDPLREHLLAALTPSDAASLRLASPATCNLVTEPLFARLRITFSPTTFTRPPRMAALARIGHHVEHLTFRMAHSPATFLPPLVHSSTGREIAFLYAPHTTTGSALTRPRYANTELGTVLTQQYPPLFHAATNVPSFIRALRSVPNLRHLTLRCPGQDPRERYRRSIVDYALISLRIAVERAPLEKLRRLSLACVHPAAFNYLRHTHGHGAVPSAGRRWGQITRLSISVEAWDFWAESSPGRDHLKILDDYVRFFAPRLDGFSFAWVGPRGPCPLSLASDALFAEPTAARKLSHERTSSMSPPPTRPARAPICFPRLRRLRVRNASMSASQLRELVCRHRETVRAFGFEDVALADDGDWDEALAPLSGDACWDRTSASVSSSRCSPVAGESGEELPSQSAAVEAARRELLDLDLGGFGFSQEERRILDGLSVSAGGMSRGGDQTGGFTTKLRRKKTRRRRRKHHDGGSSSAEDQGTTADARSSPSSTPSPHHRHRPHQGEKREPPGPRPRSPLEAHGVCPPLVPPPLGPVITAPIPASGPRPVLLLQPTVYDPSRSGPSADGGITPVRRNLEREEACRLLAQDPDARVGALRKAKQAVLSKLSREFCAKRTRAADDAVAACRLVASREWSSSGAGCFDAEDMVLEDRLRCDSQSTLVPLMLSRS